MFINKEVEAYLKVVNSPKRPKLAKLFKRFDLIPHQMQEDIIDLWDNKARDVYNIMIPSGRRLGKSLTASQIVCLEMTIPQASVIFVSPSDKQLQVIFSQVVKYVKQLGLPIEKLDTNKRVLILKHGAEFYGGTAKTVTDLEGKKASLLIIEEAGLLSNLTKIIESLSPALSTYGVYEDTKNPVGRIFIIGTPKGDNIEYYELMLSWKDLVGHKVMSYKSEVNPINSKEFLEKQRTMLEPLVYAQEYEAQWVIVSGDLVFYQFEEKAHTIDMADIMSLIDKDVFIVGGLDIGATDKTAYVLVYIEKGRFYIFDYFTVDNAEEAIIASKLKELEKKYNITNIIRFIDPSAKITRLGLTNTYGIELYKGKNAIKESISLLNQLFRTNKLFINKDLHEITRQVQTLMWAENRNTKDPFKKNKKHHFDIIASIRYAIFSAHKIYGFENASED